MIHYLEQGTFTPEQAQSIQEFAANVAKGITATEKDFKTRKKIIELLNVTGKLTEEENEKVIYLRYIFDDKVFGFETTTTHD